MKLAFVLFFSYVKEVLNVIQLSVLKYVLSTMLKIFKIYPSYKSCLLGMNVDLYTMLCGDM
jgi:hypothetical protein